MYISGCFNYYVIYLLLHAAQTIEGVINLSKQEAVTLEVLCPKGVLASPETEGLSNPRVSDLNGKKIALLSEKPDSVLFFNAMERLLKQAYPTSEILRFPSPASPSLPDNTAEVAAACDVWLQGVKTSTSSRIDYDVVMEKRGRPGVTFSVDSLVPQKKCVAEINGLPTVRTVSLPGLNYFKAKADPILMDAVAAAAFNDTILALTSPLTEDEKNPEPFGCDYSPKTFTSDSYSRVYEQFQQFCVDNSWGDGLPVTPPTKEMVDEMLTGTSFSPDKEIGVVLPHGGIATVEKIAINAVMAGAKPQYLPVIIAIIECITDKNFNQNHINTGPIPVFWISGPIIKELGLNNDIAYLSPGNRVNNTIARAVALCQINIGWRTLAIYADPGGPGSPLNFTNYLIPENQENSPWDSYAVENGYSPAESTVSASEHTRFFRGPSETLYYGSFEDSMEMMAGFFKADSSYYGMGRAESEHHRFIIVLHPTFAAQMADAGYTKRSFVQWLYDKNAVVWDKMDEAAREQFKLEVADGKWPFIEPADCKPGLVIDPFSDPAHVAVLVSGNAAGTTMVFKTSTGSTAKMGDCDESFVASPFMNKVIRGASLTKAGK